MATPALTTAALAIAAQVYISPIPEVSTVKVVVTYLTANITLLAYLLLSASLPTSLAYFLSLNTIFLLTFITLTLIRRLFFHPLSHFPGPPLAACSKLWEANEFRLGRASLTHKGLHQKYDSDFVRIGPNEVSVRCVEAVEKIYKGRYTRGTFYEVGAINGEFNLNTKRGYEVFGAWRRIWERAFVSTEFKEYNPRVELHVAKFIEILKKKDGAEVDSSKILDNLIFDVMADLSFANDAGMQDETGDGLYLDFLYKFMGVVGVVGALRNLSQLLVYLPETAEVKGFRLRCEKMVADRQKLGISRKDIFRHFLAEDSETGAKFTQAELNANANLIIIAGAHTTSSTLAQTFRVMAKESRIWKKLQKEIDDTCWNGGTLTVDSTKNLVYLNAVVNEALRLLNPLPSGVQATTSQDGVEINDVFLPGNIQVQIPHIVLMTDERYFPKGEEFIPDRWTDERPELLLERKAFIPFGYGAHSCVGKQLALNEMRLIIAKVSRDFDVEFGESYDEAKFLAEWMDYAVLKIGALPLRFVRRR